MSKHCHLVFTGGTSSKEVPCQCRRHKSLEFVPWVGKIPWRRAWQPTPVFLSGESYDRRAWWATVHGVAKSQTQLKRLSMHACMHASTATSVQFSSVTQSCPTLRDHMNCSTPSLPVHHQLPEFTQTHVHRVSDAIQPSHPLSSPSPPAPNPSQHQGLFQ